MIQQGFAQLQEGQFEDAIETFSSSLTIDPKEHRSYRGRGIAELQLQQAAQAEKDFFAATQLDPSEPENWSGLALSYILQNKIYEAIKIYEDLIVSHPSFIPAYMQMGHLQFRIGAINRGRDFLKTALTLKPNLTQRRAIESALKEQDKLDKKRYHRPDFERLRKQKEERQTAAGPGPFAKLIRKFLKHD